MIQKEKERGKISPFFVMEMLQIANERQSKGEDILHLEFGEPHVSPSKRVIRAAQERIKSDSLGYTDSVGLLELRSAIADYCNKTYHSTIKKEQVIVTPGSSGSFILSFLALFKIGSLVAHAVPGYPAHANIISALGLKPFPIVVGPETNYQPTIEHLKKLKNNISGIIITSPSNPTGGILKRNDLKDIISFCKKRNIWIISDEIYHGISFHKKAISVLDIVDISNEKIIVINGFSKYFAMPGWRLGWSILPENLTETFKNLAQNFFISAPTLSQYAAIQAFNSLNDFGKNVALYKRNRDFLLEELTRIGFKEIFKPQGAFYLYLNVSHLTNNSTLFCMRMLNEIGVAVAPGIDFDPFEGKKFIRIAFSRPLRDIKAAIKRIKNWKLIKEKMAGKK
ncbi:MAG: aminotransferase class I/II-fold pyridoxal phosphate-dependent enzyme [Pseudomonadota bacterium]|nr:aminotransferase class I/II-fold pyridoxal phosphate-dependent enzyme [Pseudomonadota bacterium]MEE3261178.1 aminotransferase class I/II-fold pyridoxal phosphate-dependent enzyme [Pseudomonadota bacterium]